MKTENEYLSSVIGKIALVYTFNCPKCNYQNKSNKFLPIFDFKNKSFGFQCPKCDNIITKIKYISTIYSFNLEIIKE